MFPKTSKKRTDHYIELELHRKRTPPTVCLYPKMHFKEFGVHSFNKTLHEAFYFQHSQKHQFFLNGKF